MFCRKRPQVYHYPPLWQPPADISASEAPPPDVVLIPLPAAVPAPLAPPEELSPPPLPDAPPPTGDQISPPPALDFPPPPAPLPSAELPLPPAPETMPADETPPPVTSPPPTSNLSPSLVVPGAQLVDEGATLSFAVSASDPDAGQTASVQTSLLPAGATFDGTTFTWVPAYTQAGTYTVSFIALDNGAPPVSSTQLNVVITVTNVHRPPVANAGPDQMKEATGPNTTVVTLDGSGSSHPDGDALKYTWRENNVIIAGPDDGPTAQVGLSLGEHTITLTVNDGQTDSTTPSGSQAQNQSDETVVVEIVDTTAPVITAPVVVTLEATSAQGVSKELAAPEVTDLVGPVTVINSWPSTNFPLGTTTVTWTATDGAGNSSTATQQVTVTDNTPPVVIAPAGVSAEATGPQTTVNVGTASATDLVDGTMTVANNAPATFPVGVTTVTYTATDVHGNAGIATQTVTVGDLTPPVISAPADRSVEATGPRTPVGIGTATATDAVGVVVISNNAPATFPIGITVVTWTAKDAAGNAGTGTQNVTVRDTTPPTITLNGANPLFLELGSIYPEAGASASDLVDGNLSTGIQISGSVNPNSEGSYTLTYAVNDQAGNAASTTRTVQVVVTPNSYGLIATHSLHLRNSARINSGFAGVVNRGQAPFLAGKVELVVGTNVQTGPEVRLSAPRVRVRKGANVAGVLVYNELVSVEKRATIADREQVGPEYFPLFQGFGLPAFQTGTPGTQDVEVRQKGSATISAGSYDEVRVKQKGTLTFTGGTYQLGDLEAGQQAKVIFLAPTTLLIRGQLSLDQKAIFGPGSGLNASDILVYVEGRNGRLGTSHEDDEGNDEGDDAEGRRLRQSPRAVKVGEQASFQGNLYALNGTLHLRQGFLAVGSFIARDIIVGVRVQVAAQSGWNTPGVIYQPQAPVVLAKLAGEQGEAAALPTETGLLANYPNPFNPTTTVPYVVAEAALVKLSVYNVLGQQIRVLVDQLQVPGAYTVNWDGLDAAGQQVAGGVYFYRLEVGIQHAVGRMLLLR